MQSRALETAEPVHEIHTSERKSFRGCRRRWAWIFRDNYYPKVTAKPLEFGVAYHGALEVYYNPDTWHLTQNAFSQPQMVEVAVNEFKAICTKQKIKFIQNSGEQYLEDEVETDYAERVELGSGMLRYHLGQIAPKADAINGFKPVKAELTFRIPVYGPGGKILKCYQKGCLQHPEGPAEVWFAGRIDCLIEDQDGGYWIYDWKTAARMSTDRDEFLDLDDQIASYVYALRVIGLPVRGFVYHEQKKGFPQAPEENKVRRLGRLFSVNRQQDTSYDLYLQTVKEKDTEAYEQGLYDDFLHFLKEEGQIFWMRYQKHKSDNELKEVGLNLWHEAIEMVNPDLYLYPNPGRFSCGFCAFRQPCLEKNDRGDYKYALETLFEKRKDHYWVREQTTEHAGRTIGTTAEQ